MSTVSQHVVLPAANVSTPLPSTVRDAKHALYVPRRVRTVPAGTALTSSRVKSVDGREPNSARAIVRLQQPMDF